MMKSSMQERESGEKSRRGPRRSKQYDKKLASIIQTGARMFNERGYENTSLDDIAKKVKMHKTTLYHYVNNKEDILYRSLQITLEGLAEDLNNAEVSSEPPIERLRRLFMALIEVQTSDFGKCLCLVGPQPLGNKNGKQIRNEMRRLDKVVQELIRQGIADGSMVECDPRLASAMLFGAFNWVARWYEPGRAFLPSDIGKTFMSLFINGVVPR